MIGLIIYVSILMVVLHRIRPLSVFEHFEDFALSTMPVVAVTQLDGDHYKAVWLGLALLTAWSSVLQASASASVSLPALRRREWSARASDPVLVA